MNKRSPSLVANLVKQRAFIFTCSYQTAWSLWLDEEEQQGYKYTEIAKHLKGGGSVGVVNGKNQN